MQPIFVIRASSFSTVSLPLRPIDLGGGPGDYNAYTVQVIDEAGEIKKTQVAVNLIDGGGRTLMPGMIDSHMHFAGYTPFNIQARQNVNEFMVGGLSMVRAESMLMRGIIRPTPAFLASPKTRRVFTSMPAWALIAMTAVSTARSAPIAWPMRNCRRCLWTRSRRVAGWKICGREVVDDRQ